MKIVKNTGKACFLACLESFFADNAVVRTQAEMIDELHTLSLCNKDGVAPYGTEHAVFAHYGIVHESVCFQFPIAPIFRDGSLLIFFHSPGLHCVRFYHQPEPTKILVMDPDHGLGDDKKWEYRYVDKEELFASKPKFVRIHIS
jgi:hypothetical protein